MVRRHPFSRRAEARWWRLGLLAGTLLLLIPGPPGELTNGRAVRPGPSAPHLAVTSVGSAVSSSAMDARYGHLRGPWPAVNWSSEMARALQEYHGAHGLIRPFGHHVRRVLPVAGGNVYVGGNSLLVVDRNLTVGNVTVAGNGTLAVFNASHRVTLTINGNVRLEDHGIFFVNGSNVVANESYDDQLSVTATNSSFFLLLGANVSANGHQWIGSFLDRSNLTVVGSYYCSPSSWFPITVAGNASVFLEGSWFLSDIVMQDTVYLPSSAHLTIDSVLGFNLWLGLKQRAHANVTLPGPLGFRSFTFPGPLNVSGVNYSVAIQNSFVGYDVLTVWPGSSLTLTNTPGVVIALDPVAEVMTLSGFRQGWLNWSFVGGGFALRLYDTEVASWNLYPYGSVLTVNDSEFGEILTNTGSEVTVVASNLTGAGGYYGAFGASSLSIYGSHISDEVIGNDQGTILLVDCTDSVTGPPRQILATGNSSIRAVDVTLGPSVTYGSSGQGTVWVGHTVDVTVRGPAGPAANAAVRVLWAGNDSLATSAVTPPNGSLDLELASSMLGPTGARNLSNYLIDATLGTSGGTSMVSVTGPTAATVSLVPLVGPTSPANGSSGVVLAPSVSIEFGLPMRPGPTGGALSVFPSASWVATWSANDTHLTLAMSGLRSDTTYRLTLAPGAETQSGIGLPAPWVLVFTTLSVPTPPPAPSLLDALPVNGAQGISPWQNITLTFDEAMDPVSVALAFSLSPSQPSGTLNISGSVVRWSHTSPLPAETAFTLRISTSAHGADGAALAKAVWLNFSTGAPLARADRNGVAGTSPSAWAATGELALSVLLSAGIVGTALLIATRRRRGPPVYLPPPPEWLEQPPR